MLLYSRMDISITDVEGKTHVVQGAGEVIVRMFNKASPPTSPWRPPGEVWLHQSKAKVIEMAQRNATIRLEYNDWHWGEASKDAIPHPSAPLLASFDRMAQSSDAVTRSLLGWLGSMRGSDADFNPEFEAVKEQIRLVEEDECGRSDFLSDVTSNSHTASLRRAELQFDDAEPVDWDGDVEKSYAAGFFYRCVG
jgi:hypothetical protein